jgi:hypothetical protein
MAKKKKPGTETKRDRQTRILDELGIKGGPRQRMRDFSAERFEKDIRIYKQTGKLPDAMPSYKALTRTPTKTEVLKDVDLAGPRTRKGGQVVMFWKDETEEVSGKQMKHAKRIAKLHKSEEELLTEIYGKKSIATEGYLKQKFGDIGITKIEVIYSDADLERLKQKYKGWTLIYKGNGTMYKDLLVNMAVVISQGIYQPIKKTAQLMTFISKINQVNPKAGKRLLDDFKKYYGSGYFE